LMAVRTRVVDYAKALWGGMGSWRDADVERFVNQVLPRVLAGQRSVAGLTDAYLARVIGASQIGVVDTSALRGVDPTEVYRRPAVQMRTDLSTGVPFPTALKGSLTRLVSLVSTDIQLASRAQSHQVMEKRRIAGYRRVLVGPGDCALCVIASTQRYHRGNLLPIHPGCNCTVDPQVIDSALLNATHQQVAEFAGVSDPGARDLGNAKKTSAGKSVSDYTDLIITHQHGELGAVLAWRGQAFTAAADL